MNKLIINDNEIRELLNSNKELKIEKKELTSKSNKAVQNILSSKRTLESYAKTKKYLFTLYENLKDIFDFAKVPMELRNSQFLNKTGLAMSPINTISTITDTFRVSGFIRAINVAIKDLKEIFKGETIHIVYPACGPLAPLLLPLLAYYKSNNIYTSKDIKVTFIDIQQGSIIPLVNLLKLLELEEFVKDVLCIDAVEYKNEKTIHLVILEAMQHGFTKEGHLSISKHFASLIHKNGLMLPQNIKISAILALGDEEYKNQWKDTEFCSSFKMKKEFKDKRIFLGEILNINLSSLKKMEVLVLNENTHLIKCASLTIPFLKKDEKQYILLFTTNITIYKDEILDEYDSGITHPLPDLNICINFIPKSDKRPTDLYVKSSERIDFYYKLVGLPGFLLTKGDENE